MLDDYEGHVPRAASLAVDVRDPRRAGEDVAGTDGEEGFDPLAGHVDRAFELEVQVGGFVGADEGCDEGGRGDDIAVGATGGGFLVDEERVGLADGTREAQDHFTGDGMGRLVEVLTHGLPIVLQAVLGWGLGGVHSPYGPPSRGP